MIVTEAPEFWMLTDPKRLTCPVCKISNVYGVDQLYYEAGLTICTGIDEEASNNQEVEGEIPF